MPRGAPRRASGKRPPEAYLGFCFAGVPLPTPATPQRNKRGERESEVCAPTSLPWQRQFPWPMAHGWCLIFRSARDPRSQAARRDGSFVTVHCSCEVYYRAPFLEEPWLMVDRRM